MELTKANIVIISFILAVMITVTPVFNPNNIPSNSKFISGICSLVTTNAAGYPLKWAGYLYCSGYKFLYNTFDFAVDVIFWSIIIAIMLFVMRFTKKRNAKKSKKSAK